MTAKICHRAVILCLIDCINKSIFRFVSDGLDDWYDLDKSKMTGCSLVTSLDDAVRRDTGTFETLSVARSL